MMSDNSWFSITMRYTCENAGTVPVGATGGVVFTVMDSRLNPPVSKYNVMSCGPAPSIAVSLMVVQFCHPPVSGTETVLHTALGPLKPTWIKPPPVGDATRSCTL